MMRFAVRGCYAEPDCRSRQTIPIASLTHGGRSLTQANIFERAFAIARAGRARSIEDVRRTLKAESFENVESHLAGPSIKRQLKQLLAEAAHPDLF